MDAPRKEEELTYSDLVNNTGKTSAVIKNDHEWQELLAKLKLFGANIEQLELALAENQNDLDNMIKG